MNDEWDAYLARFHGERSGITEDVLRRATSDDGRDPYDWVAQALPSDLRVRAVSRRTHSESRAGTVVDIACGSGPLAIASRRWVGLDGNLAELGLAARVAPGRVVVADASAAPFRAGAADAVVCSMALMLLPDPGRALVEMTRLVGVGGRLVLLVPATAPLTVRDRARYVRLLVTLRARRFPFRHQQVLDEPGRLLAPAGLSLVSDERRRFAFPFATPDDVLLWTRSLYLPGRTERWLPAARRLTRQWVGTSIGIPLRRLVATRNR